MFASAVYQSRKAGNNEKNHSYFTNATISTMRNSFQVFFDKFCTLFGQLMALEVTVNEQRAMGYFKAVNNLAKQKFLTVKFYQS